MTLEEVLNAKEVQGLAKISWEDEKWDSSYRKAIYIALNDKRKFNGVCK